MRVNYKTRNICLSPISMMCRAGEEALFVHLMLHVGINGYLRMLFIVKVFLLKSQNLLKKYHFFIHLSVSFDMFLCSN